MNKCHLKKGIKLFVAIAILNGVFKICAFYKNAFEKERNGRKKNRVILKMFSKWIQSKNQKKEIETYLKEMNFKTIAIYGMGDAGKRLYEEIKDTSIKIEYAIDKRNSELECDIPVLSLADELYKVDVIIVTAICDFPEISGILKNKTESQIISLEQIIDEL